MPTEYVIFLTDVTAYYSEYVPPQNCLLSRLPLRVLQLSTSTHHSFFELHDTSMGHALPRLYTVYFYTPYGRLGSTGSLLPPTSNS
jgi:hypothetical protein